MFGAITIPAEMPSGITLSDFALDADAAQQMMQVAADNRRSARTAISLDYPELAAYHVGLAGDWQRRASDQMWRFRSAVMERTEREREDSYILVGRGGARFVGPACSGETCDDCERPLWHHIQLNPTLNRDTGRADWPQALCPFGRWYWTLARAILWSDMDLARMEIHARLAEIARG